MKTGAYSLTSSTVIVNDDLSAEEANKSLDYLCFCFSSLDEAHRRFPLRYARAHEKKNTAALPFGVSTFRRQCTVERTHEQTIGLLDLAVESVNVGFELEFGLPVDEFNGERNVASNILDGIIVFVQRDFVTANFT